MNPDSEPFENTARRIDADDPLAPYRDRFLHPVEPAGTASVYLCGNSLGLQPVTARREVERELELWARSAVDGHFGEDDGWYRYQETLRPHAADLVGACPDEIVHMNGLTANLHLMMATFYRPTERRHKILVEEHAFPSDAYAVRSQIAWHGFDPDRSVVVAEAREGECVLRTGDIVSLLESRGGEIALVLMSGVSYFTGQRFDMERIASTAREQGCLVGFDLAHAVGNVPLALHDWGIDFAAWCTYKYLNAGPGAVAGCFVHRRHGKNASLPRLAGWWGNDPHTRFRMEPTFTPVAGADGWQVSNPPVLALAPLRASLEIFRQAGMEALRDKSVRLTGFLLALLRRIPGDRFRILTPADPEQRGCQVSIRMNTNARETFRALRERGFVGDFREPDIIRVAPVPLYNTFHEAWRFARALEEVTAGDRDA